MKRFIQFILSFVLMFMLLTPITAFAVEITAGGEEINYNTIFTRLWEFVEDNKTEVVSAAESLLLLAVSGIVKVAISKAMRNLGDQMKELKEDAQGKNKVQTSIVGAINQMITGYNVMKDSNDTLKLGYADMKAAYEINATKEDDRNRLIGAVMVQNTAVLEILASVFVHNKNLPQGVKDLITLKYANTLKALDDDALLRSIVEAVREKVNFEAPVEVPSDGEAVTETVTAEV